MAIDRAAAARAIDAFLRAIGRDPDAEPDLVGTGARVADAFVDDLCAGYAVDTRGRLEAAALPSSADTAGLVVVRDIPVVTMCPHHLLPATGTASVAFLPTARLVGIGAVAELVAAHARRLTLQERIGNGVVADLEAVIAPAWAACRLVLVHGCMIARGDRVTGAQVETIAIRGTDEAARREARGALARL